MGEGEGLKNKPITWFPQVIKDLKGLSFPYIEILVCL